MEQIILDRKGSPSVNSSGRDRKLSKRQESFYGLRDFTANIALKLKQEFSVQSPLKIKRMPSILVDDKILKEDRSIEDDFNELMYDYCSICYTTTIQSGDEPITDGKTFEF